MRPDRSVMHSPRLTNRNGVRTRMAPPSTASGTVHEPSRSSVHVRTLPGQEDPKRPYSVVAGQDEDEDDALQHQHRGVRQAQPALQQAAAGADAAEQDRDRDDRQRIVPRQEGDQDAGKAVAGGEIGVGAALHGRDLDHAGEAGRGRRRESRSIRISLPTPRPDDLARRGRCRRRRARRSRTRCDRSGCRTRSRRRCRTPGPNARRCRESLPIMLAAPISRVDGLLRLAGSRIGPSTRWLRIASAI